MPDTLIPEAYISVDIESSGPHPGLYSLLSIGACLVSDPRCTFYVELQPLNENATEEALLVSGLSLARLAEKGTPPAEAMAQFDQWLAAEAPRDHRMVFVAFNAAFDWMFVHEYFHRYLGRNPFGHSALDIKAFYMGMSGSQWQETGMRQISRKYLGDRQLTHNALRDAIDQAEIFQKLLDFAPKNNPDPHERGDL